MTRALRVAKDLTLPLDAATQTFLVVGKRGSGKTTTADLKSSKDGKHPGLKVYVFGGRHADLPLEPTAGGLLADTIIEHRISAVLFQKNRTPLHVFGTGLLHARTAA